MLKSAICRARSNAKGAGVYKIRRSYFSTMYVAYVRTDESPQKKGSCTCVVDGCQSKRKNVVGREFSILSLNFSFVRVVTVFEN